MAKLTLTDIAAGFGLITTYNANNALLEAALENTLSRDGTAPNTMSANLDMNSQRVVNLANAISGQDAITLSQLNAASIVVSTVLGSAVTLDDVGGFYTLDTAEGALAEIFETPSETTRRVLELATQAETDAGTDDVRVITPLKLQTKPLFQATQTAKGALEIATSAEVITGTDNTRAVTPSGLAALTTSETRDGLIELATQAEVDAGTDVIRAVTPATLKATPSTAGGFSFAKEKTADETLNTNTVLQDDNDLNLGTIPNGTYRVELLFFLGATVDGSMGIKYRLDFSGVTSRNQLNRDSLINQTVVTGLHNINLTRLQTTITTIAVGDWVHWTGTMTVTTPGVLKLQWAQNSSNANNLTVGDNSFLVLQKIA